MILSIRPKSVFLLIINYISLAVNISQRHRGEISRKDLTQRREGAKNAKLLYEIIILKFLYFS